MNGIVILLIVILSLLVIAGLLLTWLVISVSIKAKRTEKNIKKVHHNVDEASTMISAVSAGLTFTTGLIDGIQKRRGRKQQKSRSKQR